jgi:hypothetical protein
MWSKKIKLLRWGEIFAQAGNAVATKLMYTAGPIVGATVLDGFI